ncbi:transferase family hexapeptide repeat protein [Mucilaginibacter yixingensis]|uniref:Transferase family hexapeptide repeat protein n=1 Tax=Mucilaginibacter yixingensis TaxID=1295612 RepID=A0A2T5JFT3_9SPHI|nr:transferase family hexapeptide repeat protein [Mucilaginibacter yixingensis]
MPVESPPPTQTATDTVRVGLNSVLDKVAFGKYNSVGTSCYLYNTQIGNYTYLSNNVSVMNTYIGKFCSIAEGVKIALGKHPVNGFISTHPAFFSTHKQCGTTFASQNHFREMGETHIGNDVWIGANAVIMDDVVVGDGAIIGAGAIVTKNVPPYAIVVGIPGRVLRYRFDEQQITDLLAFKWWDKDEEWLAANYQTFHNSDHFFDLIRNNLDNS